jgi:hypothetical protein
MWFNDTIELGTETETVTYGEPIKTYTWRKVYADHQGDGKREKTSGDSTGFNPELKFVVRAFEYSGEMAVRYKSKTYTVIRADSLGDNAYLYLSRVVE